MLSRRAGLSATAGLRCIFDEQLTFSDHSLSESCYSHIRELRCIRPYLDSKQPVPSLPLLSALNLTSVTLCTAVFLSLK